MTYELQRLMNQYGISTPSMAIYAGAKAPKTPSAPVLPAGANTKQQQQYAADLEAYNKSKTDYDKQLAQQGVDKPIFDAYAAEYRNRLQNTDLYNQPQFSTIGASVPAITTFSPAQRSALGFGGYEPREPLPLPPSMEGLSPAQKAAAYNQYVGAGWSEDKLRGLADKYYGPQKESDWEYLKQLAVTTPPTPVVQNPVPQKSYSPEGVGQNTLNRDVGGVLSAYPNMRPEALAELQQHYGVSDYDLRNAIGTGVKRGTPQWGDLLRSPAGVSSTPGLGSTPVTPVAPTTPQSNAPQGTGYQVYPFDFKGTGRENYNNYLDYLRFGPDLQEVRGYQEGGRVVGPSSQIPAGMQTPQFTDSAGTIRQGLQELLERYGPQDRNYAEEVQMARQRAQAETGAFADTLNKMLAAPAGEDRGSKAEMYFRLAAAFGTPTRSGMFGENLALAGDAMADTAKDRRAMEQQRRNTLIEVQKLKMDAAKGDLAALRALEVEAGKDRRAVAQEAVKGFVRLGSPQSQAGKSALDMGYVPGTPEYQSKVGELASLEAAKQQALLSAALGGQRIAEGEYKLKQEQATRLSPTEIRLKKDTEDSLRRLEQVKEDLKEAYRINPATYAGGWIDKAQHTLLSNLGSEHPTVVNTNKLINLLGQQAVAKLKDTFGGSQITDAEREALMALEGITSRSREERDAIIKRAYKVAADHVEQTRNRLEDITSGKYRTTKPTMEE